MKSTFSTSPLSYASIDVFLSHTDSFKSSFATFSEWVFFLGDPVPEAVQYFTLMDTFSGIQILEHGEVEKKNETK